jgi:hypothetical protein
VTKEGCTTSGGSACEDGDGVAEQQPSHARGVVGEYRLDINSCLLRNDRSRRGADNSSRKTRE